MRTPVALLVTLLVLAASLAPGAVDGDVPLLLGPAAVLAGLAAAAVVLRHAVRRLGGVTGDVLGCLVEVATTAALVAVAVA